MFTGLVSIPDDGFSWPTLTNLSPPENTFKTRPNFQCRGGEFGSLIRTSSPSFILVWLECYFFLCCKVYRNSLLHLFHILRPNGWMSCFLDNLSNGVFSHWISGRDTRGPFTKKCPGVSRPYIYFSRIRVPIVLTELRISQKLEANCQRHGEGGFQCFVRPSLGEAILVVENETWSCSHEKIFLDISLRFLTWKGFYIL